VTRTRRATSCHDARVTGSWERRIRRAEELAASGDATASLLAFYARLLERQKAVYDGFSQQRPSGSFEQDLTVLASNGSAMLREVAEYGPEQLAAEARTLLESGETAIRSLLRAYWHARSDRAFFAKALLQPYGQWLADAGVNPMDHRHPRTDNSCPRCGGAPQLSILDAGSAMSGDGSSRQLLCASCLTTWPFRRVVCPQCGEEDERKLGYFHSPSFEHVRVDACDTCCRYLKNVDLTKLGLCVPLVDEIAAAPLDAWAREHGYEKIELNLVGL
jgi:formate dehydrogenase maturation protein FdhE